MIVVRANESILQDVELVATIGFFDGVHLGHRYLIEQVKQEARIRACKSAVVTFSIHPRKVLQADFQPLLLTSYDEKLHQLETTGVDYCIVLDFSIQMSQLTAYQFLSEVLYRKYTVRALFIGHDHRFGHNRSEGFDDYQKYGTEIGIKIVSANRFSLPEYSHVSSSEIRHALQTGDVRKASALLNYLYCFEGVVTDGFKIGRKIGFPTANIKPLDAEKLIPAAAVYAVRVNFNDDIYAGMMNIGIRPTMNNGLDTSLEVNIFDFNYDIYHQKIGVCLIVKIRNEQKFNTVDELIMQLQKDRKKALEILSEK